jgi:tRNA-intron endonuclease
MIKAKFSGDKISSNSEEAFSLFEKSYFGEKKQGRVEYALVEALFLVQERKMGVFVNNSLLTEEKLIKKVKKIDKKIETKLSVFSDLRKKGYIIKTALKFGAEFRIYDKGYSPGKAHARWLLFTAKEHENINWHEFAGKNRIAHSTNKALLIGIVDEESDVSYYQVEWLKP